MAKRKFDPYGPADPEPLEQTTATAEIPPPADPQPNGDPVTPAQPARTVRRPRDPNAPRPFFLLCAVEKDTESIRVLMREETIGRARKIQPRLRNLISREEIGPVILRCKIAG